MNLHHLYYFQAVAQLQSFTKASESLFVSQPTLSYAINCLEKELGVTLLSRNGKYATLTNDGKIFLEHVNNALDKLDKGVASIHAHANPTEDTVRIYSDHVMNIVSEVRNYRECANDDKTEFSLERSEKGDIEEQILLQTYDIGFQMKLPTLSGLDYVQLPNSDLVLIVPLRHPLAEKDDIDLREVDWNQNVVARYIDVPDSRSFSIASIYQQIGYDISKASSRARTALGVASLVEAGFGIAVIPRVEHLKNFDVKILKITYPSVESLHYMLKRRHMGEESAADRFFRFVAHRYGQDDPIKL